MTRFNLQALRNSLLRIAIVSSGLTTVCPIVRGSEKIS
jgi:hypothetical protein